MLQALVLLLVHLCDVWEELILSPLQVKRTSLFLDLLIFMAASCHCVYMCSLCVTGVPRDQKRELNLLELKLQIIRN